MAYCAKKLIIVLKCCRKADTSKPFLLTLSMLGKNSADNSLKYFSYLFFFQKIGFDISCKLPPCLCQCWIAVSISLNKAFTNVRRQFEMSQPFFFFSENKETMCMKYQSLFS